MIIHIYFIHQETADKAFDVNRRMVYAMRNIGQGYTSLEQFSALMNMPKPMTKKNFYAVNKKFLTPVNDVAEQTMLDATQELLDMKDSTDVGVSVDGAW